MASQQSEAQNRTTNIICPKCGAVGVVIWENENSDDRTLVSLSRNFYEKIPKKTPYPMELVCDGYGAAQPGNRLERPSANRSAES